MPLELVDPAVCPGLLEFISIGSFLFSPYLSAGSVFRVLHVIVIVGVTAAFLQLVRRTTNSSAIAASAVAAIALSPLFPQTLSPPSAAGAFAACAAIAMMTQRLGARPVVSRRAALQMNAVLLIAALVVPPWTAIAALSAATVTWIAFAGDEVPKRVLVTIALPAAIMMAVIALLFVSPPDALTESGSFRSVIACVVPLPDLSLERLVGVVRSIGWALGPSVIILAGLGEFVMVRRGDVRILLPIAGVTAGSAVMGAVGVEIASIPIVLVAWWLAGVGLQELIAAMGRNRPAQIAAMLVLVLMPTLQLARRTAEERDDRVPPNGHERLTLQRMRGILNITADNASIVQEDATVDLLLRAAKVRRQVKRFVVIPREAEIVDRARTSGPIYAFPRAQLDLGLRGFMLQPVSAAGRRRDGTFEEIRGLATIAFRRRCRLMGSEWSDVSEVGAAGRLAVVAENRASFGPVVIFLGGPAAPAFTTDAWTPRMMRGFQSWVFDRQRSAETTPLQAEAQAFGVPADHPVLAALIVSRLSLHRIPRAPLALPVDLGGSFPVAMARLDPTASSERLYVCDASGAEVVPLEAGESR